MQKTTHQKVQQESQINQTSTATCNNHIQNDNKYAKKVTNAGFILIVVLLAVILLISLVAIVLPTISYTATDSHKMDSQREYLSKIVAQFNTCKMNFMEFQLN